MITVEGSEEVSLSFISALINNRVIDEGVFPSVTYRKKIVS